VVPFWRRVLFPGAGGQRCWAQLNRRSVGRQTLLAISENLGLVAELAIGLAGFSGLVGIVGRRVGRDAPEVDAARLRAALEFSLLVTAFALLPSLPSEAGMRDSDVWRLCSALFSASGVAFTVFKMRSTLSLPNVSFRGWHVFWPSLSASAVFVLIAAAFDSVPLTAAYLWGLYVYLTLAALTFLRLVLSLLATNR